MAALNLNVTPVFKKNLEAYEDPTVTLIVNEGGTRCFASGTIVCVEHGIKPIEDIKVGDRVLSFDGKDDVFKTVTEIHKMVNTKQTVKLKMKNGATITVTDDHQFYFEGRWIELKHLLTRRRNTWPHV